MGLILRVVAICISVFMILSTKGYGDWQGATEVLTGSWGKNDNQFGLEHGDTSDDYPLLAAVLPDGKIVISDQVNKREIIYDKNGALIKVVPWEIYQNGTKKTNPDYSIYQFWNIQGYTTGGNIWMKIEDYILKSPTGVVVKTTSDRPPELGKVIEKPISSSTAKITVQYPDRTWSYIDIGRQPSYMRDKNGNLYGYGSSQVTRYTTCGKEAASLMMPKKIEQSESSGPQVEPKVTVLEEYGPPVIGPNGDVYTWKRTPDTYSILKWTWVDDPNAPADIPDTPAKLTLRIAPAGINLFWQAVPQDPGCVTGYEIARSTNSGGQYSTIAKVNAGTANARGWIKYTDSTAETTGTTYYYKVRAAGGTGYSSYTTEVSGKR